MSKDFSRILAASALFTLGLFTSGCGTGETSGETVVGVSGTVFLDGKPLPDADVNFLCKEFVSTARTNSEGHYELVLGAIPGDNKIFISKWKGGKLAIEPEKGMDEGQFFAMQDPARLGVGNKSGLGPEQIIPSQYSDPQKSTIVFKVPEAGTETADFRISSK